jgi:hypothetical protein
MSTPVFTEGNDVFLLPELGGTFDALGGDDSVTYGGGMVQFDGGEGADTFSVAGYQWAVWIDLGEGPSTRVWTRDTLSVNDQSVGTWRVLANLTSVEKLVGTAHADRLIDDDGDNELHGGGGADHIIISGGNDTVFGGEGYDHIQVGSGSNTVSGGAGLDTVQLARNYDQYRIERVPGAERFGYVLRDSATTTTVLSDVEELFLGNSFYRLSEGQTAVWDSFWETPVFTSGDDDQSLSSAKTAVSLPSPAMRMFVPSPPEMRSDPAPPSMTLSPSPP